MMQELYKRELDAFLKMNEDICPPNLTEEQKEARQNMLTELFAEMMIDTVWDLDEREVSMDLDVGRDPEELKREVRAERRKWARRRARRCKYPILKLWDKLVELLRYLVAKTTICDM